MPAPAARPIYRPHPAVRPVVVVLFLGTIALSYALGHRGARSIVPVGPQDGSLGRHGFRLVESARALGLDFHHHAPHFDPKIANIEAHVAGLGAAVSVCDANGDGWPDLYATNSDFGHGNALFLNRGDGTFSPAPADSGASDVNRAGVGVSMASIWADVDADGDEDLFLVRFGYPALLRNRGDATFEDVTEASGLKRWMNAVSACWIDFDRDGRLDLYVGGYFREELDLWNLTTTDIMQESFEFARNGGRNVLFRNVGGGRFEDVTDAMGVQSTRWTLAVTAADFDGDGWTDLYLANDYGPEELFLNRQGARFERAGDVGLEGISKSGMSVSVGDVRGKGRLDVYVTNISRKGFLFQGNNLRLNEIADRGRMRNIAEGDVADCGWAWGSQFADLDDDGLVDLFVANGFISGSRERDYWYDMGRIASGAGNLFRDASQWTPIGDRSLSGYERSRVLKNLGDAQFVDVAQEVGEMDVLDGRAVAVADLARRGAVDVIVANQKGPLVVYRSLRDPANGSVSFRLEGAARGDAPAPETSNRSAVGAEVRILWESGGVAREQAAVVDGGSGLSAQNDKVVRFGLGRDARVRDVSIRWPSGRLQRLGPVAVGRIHSVEEPR